MLRRNFLRSAATLALVPAAGCSSLGGDGSAAEESVVGESWETDRFAVAVPRVEIAGEIVLESGDSREELQNSEGVYAIPWVRVENLGDSELDFPDPLSGIDMLYQSEEPTYVGGRNNEITIEEDSYPTYRVGYRELTGSFASGVVVEGLGTIYSLPEGFDPTEAAVRITIDEREHRWFLQGEDGEE